MLCGVAALPREHGGAAIFLQSAGAPAAKAAASPSLPADFSLPDAMKALYGNYDAAKKASTFRLTKKFPHTFFDKSGKVEVHEFLAAGAMDSGAMKVFVLTYAVPAAAPEFSCHACAPVIGAAIFAKKNDAWTVESAEKSLTMFWEILAGRRELWLCAWAGPRGLRIDIPAIRIRAKPSRRR